MKHKEPLRHSILLTGLLLLLFSQTDLMAQVPPQQHLGTPSNQASQRYEVNQTFDGRVFRKDQNVWAYDKAFADLFGMPEKHIDAVQGVAAVAFRIEDRNILECGYGAKEANCRKIEDCVLDLYFDESKTPLPWATDLKSQWLPWTSSMIWLRPLDRKEKPYGMDAPDTPDGVIRNQSLSSPIVAFADPTSRRQAIFSSNITTNSTKLDDVSWAHAILGYTKDFYKSLSVVSLQTICYPTSRSNINIYLDAKVSGIYEAPIAKFNRIALPEGFVRRINEALKANSDRNAAFYRSLFSAPLGTADQPSSSPNTATR